MNDRIFYPGPGHIGVFGDPRTRKTSGVVGPNILLLDDRPIVIANDCRGDAFISFVRHRRTRGPVFVANAMGLHDAPSDGFNFLIGLDPLAPDFFANSLAHGEATVERRYGETSPIFNLASQQLTTVITMMVKLGYGPAASQADVQKAIALLGIPGDPVLDPTDPEKKKTVPGAASALIQKAIVGDYSPNACRKCVSPDKPLCLDPSHSAPCGYPQYDIRRGGKLYEPLKTLAAQAMANVNSNSKFWPDIVRYCQIEVGKLNDPLLMADMAKHPTLNGKPFRFRDMRKWVDPKRKKGVVTVIVMQPPKFFTTHTIYSRMMISNIINSLMEPFDPNTEPLIPLVIIDEFGALGKISAMDHINMAAGNGFQFLLVCQQLHKAKQIYGEEGLGTILSACETKICFHCDDPYTQQILADLGGMKGAWVNSWHKIADKDAKHQHQQSVPLIRGQDIGNLKEGEAFVWMKYARPIKAHLPGYFDRKAWPDLDGKWDENTTLPMNQRSAA